MRPHVGVGLELGLPELGGGHRGPLRRIGDQALSSRSRSLPLKSGMNPARSSMSWAKSSASIRSYSLSIESAAFFRIEAASKPSNPSNPGAGSVARAIAWAARLRTTGAGSSSKTAAARTESSVRTDPNADAAAAFSSGSTARESASSISLTALPESTAASPQQTGDSLEAERPRPSVGRRAGESRKEDRGRRNPASSTARTIRRCGPGAPGPLARRRPRPSALPPPIRASVRMKSARLPAAAFSAAARMRRPPGLPDRRSGSPRRPGHSGAPWSRGRTARRSRARSGLGGPRAGRGPRARRARLSGHPRSPTRPGPRRRRHIRSLFRSVRISMIATAAAGGAPGREPGRGGDRPGAGRRKVSLLDDADLFGVVRQEERTDRLENLPSSEPGRRRDRGKPHGRFFAADPFDDGRQRRAVSPPSEHGQDVGQGVSPELGRQGDPAGRRGLSRHRSGEIEGFLPEIRIRIAGGREKIVQDGGPPDIGQEGEARGADVALSRRDPGLHEIAADLLGLVLSPRTRTSAGRSRDTGPRPGPVSTGEARSGIVPKSAWDEGSPISARASSAASRRRGSLSADESRQSPDRGPAPEPSQGLDEGPGRFRPGRSEGLEQEPFPRRRRRSSPGPRPRARRGRPIRRKGASVLTDSAFPAIRRSPIRKPATCGSRGEARARPISRTNISRSGSAPLGRDT